MGLHLHSLPVRRLLVVLLILVVFLLWIFWSDVGPSELDYASDSKSQRDQSVSDPTTVSSERLDDLLIPVADAIRDHPLLTKGQLENGLRYQILSHPAPEGEVSMRLIVEAGSIMESDVEHGIAHFLEHLVFNGTPHFPEGKAMEEFQRLGLRAGTHTNAFTGPQHTVYKLDLPDQEPTTIGPAFDFFYDILDGPLFAPEEIDKERGVILEEKGARQSSVTGLFERLTLLHPEGLIGKRSPIGTEENIRRFSRADFLAFHRKWYVPSRATLVVCGDLDPEKMERWIWNQFMELPEGSPATLPVLEKVSFDPEILIAKAYSNRGASRLVLTSLSPEPPLEDNLNGFRQSLIREVMQEAIESRWRVIQSKVSTRLTRSQLSVTAHRLSGYGQLNNIFINRTNDWDQPDLFLHHWRSLLKDGIQEHELELAVKKALFGYQLEASQMASSSAAMLADALVEVHRKGGVFTSPLDDLARARIMLPTISRDDCLRCLRSDWKSGPTLISQVVSEISLSDEELLESFESPLPGGVELSPPKTEPYSLGDTALVKPLTARTEFPDLGLTQVTLANGIWVNLRPISQSENLVFLNLTFGQGIHSIPPNRPALKSLTRSLYENSGIQSLKNLELENALREKMVSWEYELEVDHHRLLGTCVSRDLELQCLLLRKLLLDPSWKNGRPRDFRQASIKKIRDYYERSEKNPYRYLYRHKQGVLTDFDTRFRAFDAEEFQATSSGDLLEWVQNDLSTGPLELTLAGDFDLDTALFLIQRTFGALPQRNSDFASLPTFPAEFANPQTIERKLDNKGRRSLVTFCYQLPLQGYGPEHRTRLKLLGDIFASRVRAQVREKYGLTYSPRFGTKAEDLLGGLNYYQVLIPTYRKNTEKVQELLREIAASFRAEPISQDELERARRPKIAWHRLHRNSPEYWIENLRGSSRDPLLIKTLEQELQTFRKTTPEDLQRLALVIFSDGAVEFILRP